jgi:hypothetical protein
MKNYRLLTIVGTIIASLGTNWLPANADQTYNGASIYRDADNIYKVGLSPSSSVAVTYESAAISKTAYSDDCGVLKISLGATPPPTLSINGSAFTLSSAPELPNRAKYKCTGGVANFKLLVDRMVVRLIPRYIFPTLPLSVEKIRVA